MRFDPDMGGGGWRQTERSFGLTAARLFSPSTLPPSPYTTSLPLFSCFTRMHLPRFLRAATLHLHHARTTATHARYRALYDHDRYSSSLHLYRHSCHLPFSLSLHPTLLASASYRVAALTANQQTPRTSFLLFCERGSWHDDLPAERGYAQTVAKRVFATRQRDASLPATRATAVVFLPFGRVYR